MEIWIPAGVSARAGLYYNQPSQGIPLARKPNYNHDKRRKELERKKKQEEKLRRKREGASDDQPRDEQPDTAGNPEPRRYE